MTDLADWTGQQQQAGVRYTGAMVINFTPPSAGGVVTKAITLLPLDRSVLIITPPIGATESLQVVVRTNDPAVSPVVQTLNVFAQTGGQVIVAYVNPDITTLWQVVLTFSSTVPETYTVYTAVDSSLPVVLVAPGAGVIPVSYSPLGPQAELDSVSVTQAITGPAWQANVQSQTTGRSASSAVGTAGGTTTAIATFSAASKPRMVSLVFAARQTVAGAAARLEVRMRDAVPAVWYYATLILNTESDHIQRDPAAPLYVGSVLNTNQTWTLEMGIITLAGAPAVDWFVAFDYFLTIP